jgi:hypothetical protein
MLKSIDHIYTAEDPNDATGILLFELRHSEEHSAKDGGVIRDISWVYVDVASITIDVNHSPYPGHATFPSHGESITR